MLKVHNKAYWNLELASFETKYIDEWNIWKFHSFTYEKDFYPQKLQKILRNAKLLDKQYSGFNRKSLRGVKDFKVFRLLWIYAVSQKGTECRHFVYVVICTSDYMLFVFILQKQSLGSILKNSLPEKCNIFTAKDLRQSHF